MPFIRLTAVVVTLLLLLLAPSATAQSPLGDPRDVGVRLVADGLTAPVTMAEPPDGTKRLFVVDQVGVLRILMPDGGCGPIRSSICAAGSCR